MTDSDNIIEGENVLTLGEMLKTAREKLGVSALDIAQQLKLKDRDIISIEKGDLSKISSGLYLSGIISQYAEIVGLDKQITNKKYNELKSTVKSEKKTKSRLTIDDSLNHSPEREVLFVSLVATLILAFILLFYYNYSIKTTHTQARDFIKTHEIK